MKGIEFFSIFQRPEFGKFEFKSEYRDDNKILLVCGRSENKLALMELVGPPSEAVADYQAQEATLLLALPDDSAIIKEQSRLGAVFLELVSPDLPKDKIVWLSRNLPGLKPTKKHPAPVYKEVWGNLIVKMIHESTLGQLLIKVEEDGSSRAAKC